jgi:hypothetical protein
VPDVRPVHSKVRAAGAAGAAATVIVFIATQCGLEITGEVGAAIATLLAALGGWIKSE